MAIFWNRNGLIIICELFLEIISSYVTNLIFICYADKFKLNVMVLVLTMTNLNGITTIPIGRDNERDTVLF